MLNDYDDFLQKLRSVGFSMGGGNAKGIFSLLAETGEGREPEDSPIRWHCEQPDIDPWEWRMRVLEEETDIAYSKLFFKTSGYITKPWYSYFLAARRGGKSFSELYETGSISYMSKRIYEVILAHGQVPLHELKLFCGIKKEDSAKFDRALTELQMKMFITMSGRARKLNKYGLEYGWNSTVFCTVEEFWKIRNVSLDTYSFEEAYEAIKIQVLTLNPDAEPKTIHRFILGA